MSDTRTLTTQRADAMARSLASLQAECERLQDDKADLVAEIARLLELFTDVENVATDPGFESDAMGWIAGYCWKARTTDCAKCQGTGQVWHINGHLTDCDNCAGLGRSEI